MANHIFSALLEALREEYGTITQAQIANAMGVNQTTISLWSKGGEPSKANLKKLIELFRKHHATTLVRPVLEFYAIHPAQNGKSWDFSPEQEVINSLKSKLELRAGIYVFYDSSGKAIYLGKTETSLYNEAKQRLKAVPNRAIYLPTTTKVGVMAHRARFISAYEVAIPAAIKNLETFMLRAFANNLLNKNGGHFQNSF